MTTRNLTTFRAAFPDESEWTEGDSLLVPDGHSIAVFLAEALGKAKLSVSEVSQHSFYGWAWDVDLPKPKAWCLLQGGDPWLLLVEYRGCILDRILGGKETDEFVQALRTLDTTMKQDPRFSAIQWFTKDEYESGSRPGVESPV